MNFYNGYIRCLSNWGGRGYFTPGKVYHVKDGKFLDDHGVCTPTFQRLETFNDWAAMALGNWEELELVKRYEYDVGDWVLVQNHRGFGWNECGDMDCFMNKVCKVTGKLSSCPYPLYRLNDTHWLFSNDDLVGALMSKKLVDSLKPTRSEPEKTCKEWTHNEIKKARNIVTEYMKMLASQRRTLIFETSKNSVKCSMIETKFNNLGLEVLCEAKATCKGDMFNEDIGMCVAACKVLNKPIPDFILNK